MFLFTLYTRKILKGAFLFESYTDFKDIFPIPMDLFPDWGFSVKSCDLSMFERSPFWVFGIGGWCLIVLVLVLSQHLVAGEEGGGVLWGVL